MLIAVSSEGNQCLDSPVSAHFGRCPYFTLAEVEDGEITSVRAVENPYFSAHRPGQVPAFVHEQGADVMLTGGMGQRAIQFFQQFGIEAATGAQGTVRHALKMYFKEELREAEPCAESKAHAASGHHHHDHEDAVYEKDEAGRLEEEVEDLKGTLDEIDRRLEDLE